MTTASRPVDPIPFIDLESMQSVKELEKGIRPVPRILKIKARTRQVVEIPLQDEEIKGYLPRIETGKGVFLGKALVQQQEKTVKLWQLIARKIIWKY